MCFLYSYRFSWKAFNVLKAHGLSTAEVDKLFYLKDIVFTEREVFLYTIKKIIGATKTDLLEEKLIASSKTVWSFKTIFTLLSFLILTITITFSVFISNSDLDKWSKVGDSFTLISSLLNGFAFLVMISTLILQRQELAQQRRELKLTRYEMEKQKDLMLKQNNTIGRQNFETTFFNMLQMHNDVVATITYNEVGFDGDPLKGRECFKHYYDAFIALYNNNKLKFRDSKIINIKESYTSWNLKYQANVAYYFRNLYNVIKFVNDSNFYFARNDPMLEKRIYIDIIKAQLSSYELLLLFFNSFCSIEFRTLINDFDLLKDLPIEELSRIELDDLFRTYDTLDIEGN